MNFKNQQHQLAESDAIFKKLEVIRTAIEGPSLNDYLPKQRLNSSYNENSESYRRSLEKRLERMFKEQRKGFIQNKNELSYNDRSSGQIDKVHALTSDKMEQKIKELQMKYMGNPAAIPTTRQQPKKIIKESQQKIKNKTKRKEPSPQHSSTAKLYSQVRSLKKQVRQIQQKNLDFYAKLNQTSFKRKDNKERSKAMLRQILGKLIKIETEIEIKDKLENRQCKYQYERDKQEMKENETQQLRAMIEELEYKLEKQTAEKQMVIQKNRWIEEQLKRINSC